MRVKVSNEFSMYCGLIGNVDEEVQEREGKYVIFYGSQKRLFFLNSELEEVHNA